MHEGIPKLKWVLQLYADGILLLPCWENKNATRIYSYVQTYVRPYVRSRKRSNIKTFECQTFECQTFECKNVRMSNVRMSKRSNVKRSNVLRPTLNNIKHPCSPRCLFESKTPFESKTAFESKTPYRICYTMLLDIMS